ncbi:hypothetical protein VULLAG_LOCUS15215 [Vulpes lagopus]
MTRKVARAVPAGGRWVVVGGRGGSKRLRGDGGRFNGTNFWNIRDCGTLRPDRDLGLRRRRWVVRRASGLDGVTPFFPHCQLLKPDRGRGERSKLSLASHLTSQPLPPFPSVGQTDRQTGFPGCLGVSVCLSVHATLRWKFTCDDGLPCTAASLTK